MEQLEEPQLAVWRAFLNAHSAVVSRIERDLAEAGAVSLVDYDVLVALVESPDERLRLRDVGTRVVLTRSGITRLVDRLETAGLLRRERIGPDRRAIYAVLTPAGRESVRQAWPIYARGIRRYFLDYLLPLESEVLGETLERVFLAARGRDEGSG